MDRVQHEAMRIILGAMSCCNRKLMYEEMPLKPLEKRRTSHCPSLLYRIIHHDNLPLLTNVISDLSHAERDYNLRGKQN